MNQFPSNSTSYKSLLPFVCFFLTYLILNIWFKPRSFKMPDITGCHLAQTTEICSAHHLRVEIIKTVDESELPDYTVIHQIPATGHLIKERQTVFIAITHKPPTLIMPSFIGASREEINALCSQHDLKPKMYTLSYPFPTDHCFCQWPSAGIPIKDNTIICYLAAQKEHIALWPNFKGQKLSAVTDTLAEHGIKTRSSLAQKPNSSHYIVDQLPKAGSAINLSRTDEIIADFKISTKRPTGTS